MTRPWLALALGAILLSVGAGCSDDRFGLRDPDGPAPRQGPPQVCTDRACADQLLITARPSDGIFPAGKHQLFITTGEGGPALYCEVEIGAVATPAGTDLQGRCSNGASLVISPQFTCSTTTDDRGPSESCVPIAGRFEERIFVPGMPARVRIVQRLTGDPAAGLFDRELAPSYREVRPNGPICCPSAVSPTTSCRSRPPTSSSRAERSKVRTIGPLRW
jgi:hypothetical protein